MNDFGFGEVPSGRPLADRLSEPLLKRGLLDVLTIDHPIEPDQPQGQAHSPGSGDNPAPDTAAGTLLHRVFGGIEWAIMGQVSLVAIARLVEAFEADLDPFIELIDQPPRRMAVAA